MSLIDFPGKTRWRPPPPPERDELQELEAELLRARIREAKLANRILAQAWSRRLTSRIVFWSFVLWLLWIISRATGGGA